MPELQSSPDVGIADVFEYKPTATELEVTTSLAQQQQPMNSHEVGSRSLSGFTEQPMFGGSATAGSSGSGGPRADIFGTVGGQLDGDSGGLSSPGVGIQLATAAAAAAGVPTLAAADTWAGWLLSYGQQLFDVSTDDVVERLRLVLVPYPKPPGGGATQDIRMRPDFYGPFWVAATAVLFLAATGNFARLVEAGHTNFKADYGLLSIAAAMIYGCLVAVPIVARVALFVSSEESANVDFRQLICVCGYALAPAIPISILCIVPFGFLRWLLVLVGLGASLHFLYEQLKDAYSVQTRWLKWTLVAAPCVGQAVTYFVYRWHFFNAPDGPAVPGR